MRLSQEQVNQLIQHLGRHANGGRITCPICGNHEWNVNDLIVEAREFHNGDMMLGGSIMPLVGITCRHCAHTMFLNALQLGFVNNNTENNGESNSTTER